MKCYSINPFTEDYTIASIDLKAGLLKLSLLKREIISLYIQGYSIREIAGKVYLSSTTIFKRKKEALIKLGGIMNGKD